ncbi:hypothetical protein Cni_G06183 [Canna indica]|uniref:Uncharacterized protein n=1 Tax=Canna indica TaxID=4628 RepID=A0AAQ3K0Z1_9LILI|nr:hypothetical protein Cni_G06183 [Canna indica]
MNRSISNRETMQDLELTLGPSYLFKAGMLPSENLRGSPEIILIEDDDDDDDLQIYPPAPPGEAYRFYPYSSSQENLIREEDLELHLGVGGLSSLTQQHLGHLALR